eukprot:TRINITY_DN4707_c0_g1_i1.p1 TRINITY_DN4707_c0_g1~~TRINITY_DN4707_c0_g1_i1.p1  ORF type:complete len:565 (+),score=119.70 TRINITY_DN4707_c0_g1_i1:214-1908(+)
MKVGFLLYSIASTLATCAAVYYSYQLKTQFYPTALYLTTNKACLIVLGNMGITIAFLLGRITVKLFLGSLKDVEVEHLNDKIGTTIMDTLLAMTIFHESLDARYAPLFLALLFSKIFHWVSSDRVDSLDHSPPTGLFPLSRLLALIQVLLFTDLSYVYYSYITTMSKGPSVMLLFGFEYTVLFVIALTTQAKYCLILYDTKMKEGRWEHKGVVLLYLEFVADMLRLGLYLGFFSLIMAYYGMPLHIIRHLYLTFRSFHRRVKELLQYRKATSNMNQRFPDVGPEELARTDRMCIVCREEMQTGKKLPCGHILHFQCLRSWLERQQTCPICRASVLAEDHQQENRAQQQPQQQQQQQQADNNANNNNNFDVQGIPNNVVWMQLPNGQVYPFFPPQNFQHQPQPQQQQQNLGRTQNVTPNIPTTPSNAPSSSSSSLHSTFTTQTQTTTTSTFTNEEEINPIREIESLSSQLQVIQNRLKLLHQLFLQKENANNYNTTPSFATTTSTTQPSTFTDSPSFEEDELLERAIQESLKEKKSEKNSPQLSDSPDDLRKRRLLRFSSNPGQQ